MDVIEFFKDKARKRHFSVALPEGWDGRVLQAARRLKD